MDTPTIAKYYREKEPMERLKLLEQSIAAEEDPEGNRNSGRSATVINLKQEIPELTDILDSG